jgi:outer membrane protein W
MMPVIHPAVSLHLAAPAHFLNRQMSARCQLPKLETNLGNNSGASVNNDSWGGALQAGFDYQIQRNWYFNVDVKYLWIDNDVRLNATGTNASSLDLDPWVFGVGIRYRF